METSIDGNKVSILGREYIGLSSGIPEFCRRGLRQNNTSPVWVPGNIEIVGYEVADELHGKEFIKYTDPAERRIENVGIL